MNLIALSFQAGIECSSGYDNSNAGIRDHSVEVNMDTKKKRFRRSAVK